jgi:hypothetical protein
MNAKEIDNIKKEENPADDMAHRALFLREIFHPLRFWNAEKVQHFVYTLYNGLKSKDVQTLNASFITDEPGLFTLIGLLKNLFEDDAEIVFPEKIAKHIEKRYWGYMSGSYEKKYATGVIAVQVSAKNDSGKLKITADIQFLGYVDDSFFEV